MHVPCASSLPGRCDGGSEMASLGRDWISRRRARARERRSSLRGNACRAFIGVRAASSVRWCDLRSWATSRDRPIRVCIRNTRVIRRVVPLDRRGVTTVTVGRARGPASSRAEIGRSWEAVVSPRGLRFVIAIASVVRGRGRR